MTIYKTTDDLSIYDLALTLYGNTSYCVKILTDNPGIIESLNEKVPAGVFITYDETVLGNTKEDAYKALLAYVQGRIVAPSGTPTNEDGVRNTPLTGFVLRSGTVTEYDTVLTAFEKLQQQMNGKEAGLSSGSTTQFLRGDKTWQTLNTAVVPESGSNVYWTQARTLGSLLTGFVASSNTSIDASDSILVALEKVQGQINNRQASLGYTPINKAGDTGIDSLTFLNGKNIDTDSAGQSISFGGVNAGTVNIGVNATVLNFGTGTASKVFNFGGNINDIFNFTGSAFVNNATNLSVADKLVRYNAGGSVGTGFGSGFEIEEAGSVTGYFKTTGGRDGFLFKAPGNGYDTSFIFAPTSARTVTFRDLSGTVAYLSDIIAVNPTSGYLPFNSSGAFANSVLYQNGSGKIGIGRIDQAYDLDIYKTDATVRVESSSNFGRLIMKNTAREWRLVNQDDNIFFYDVTGSVQSITMKGGTQGYVGFGGQGNPSATIHATGSTANSSEYVMKLWDSASGALLLVRNDGLVNIGSLTVNGGTVTAGIWQGAAIADTYISSASTWNAKEPAITAGTTAQYLRGDKSLATFATDARSAMNGLANTDLVAGKWRFNSEVLSMGLASGDSNLSTGGLDLNSDTACPVFLTTYHATNTSGFVGRSSLGTKASPSAKTIGTITSFSGRGYGATTWGGTTVSIQYRATENFTDTAQGTNIGFFATRKGSTTLTEFGRFHEGNFAIGGLAFAPNALFHIQAPAVLTIAGSGTIASTGTTVTGTGTTFLTDMAVGDLIFDAPGTVGKMVTAIASDTSLTVENPWSSDITAGASLKYRRAHIKVQNNGLTTTRFLLVSDGRLGLNLGNASSQPVPPTANLHVGKGSSTAGTSPFKFQTTGTLLGTAELGAVEISNSGDRIYYSVADNARKEFVLNDGTNLTSGRISYNTTNGRQTDNASFLFDSTTGLTLTDLNFVLGTTTGTKFGTSTSQKLAFYNSTPIAQRSGTSQVAVSTTASTAVTPFGYSTQAQADAIVTLVNELRSTLVALGLMKGSV